MALQAAWIIDGDRTRDVNDTAGWRVTVAGQLLQLGWVRFRSNESRSLHCRLGGESQSIGGSDVIVGGEENTATIAMFTGLSAPQPPPPGTSLGAGCRVGRSVD